MEGAIVRQMSEGLGTGWTGRRLSGSVFRLVQINGQEDEYKNKCMCNLSQKLIF